MRTTSTCVFLGNNQGSPKESLARRGVGVFLVIDLSVILCRLYRINIWVPVCSNFIKVEHMTGLTLSDASRTMRTNYPQGNSITPPDKVRDKPKH